MSLGPYFTPDPALAPPLPWLPQFPPTPPPVRLPPYVPFRPRSWSGLPVKRALDFNTPLRPISPPPRPNPPAPPCPNIKKVLAAKDAATNTPGPALPNRDACTFTTRPDTRTLGVQCTILPEVISQEEEDELLAFGAQEDRGTDVPDLDALFTLCEQAAMYPRLEPG